MVATDGGGGSSTSLVQQCALLLTLWRCWGAAAASNRDRRPLLLGSARSSHSRPPTPGPLPPHHGASLATGPHNRCHNSQQHSLPRKTAAASSAPRHRTLAALIARRRSAACCCFSYAMTAAKAPFLALAVVLAAWAACRQPALPAQPEAAHSAVPTHSHALNTYYLSAAGLPALELLPAAPPAASSRVPQAPAPAAPRLRLTLPLASLPAYMPIVSAKKQGLVHQLVRTSTFLSVRAPGVGGGRELAATRRV